VTKKQERKIGEALEVLKAIGMTSAQLNDRSGLCLLALLDLSVGDGWSVAESPLIGITPMMEFAEKEYGKHYQPNSRETFRRQTIHQFVQAGIALYNPDDPDRPVNSPKAVYQISPHALALIKTFKSETWRNALKFFLSKNQTLASRYAAERAMSQVAVVIKPGTTIKLSPGEHSELIKQIIDAFAPRFTPGGTLVYVGDTGEKWGYFDELSFRKFGVKIDGASDFRVGKFDAVLQLEA
jgi:hypothetical protein